MTQFKIAPIEPTDEMQNIGNTIIDRFPKDAEYRHKPNIALEVYRGMVASCQDVNREPVAWMWKVKHPHDDNIYKRVAFWNPISSVDGANSEFVYDVQELYTTPKDQIEKITELEAEIYKLKELLETTKRLALI
jgi:hypothetical protein